MPRNSSGEIPRRHALLEPGIRLLDRMRYPQKFLLIGLILCLPLVVIATLHWREQRTLAEKSRIQLMGFETLRAQSQLLRHLEMAMATTVGTLDGDLTLGARAAALRRTLSEDLARLSALTDMRRSQFDLGEAFSRLDLACQALARTNPGKVVETHEAAMRAANNLVTALTDRSGLQLTDQIVIYRLVGMVTTMRRLVTRRLAYLWCLTDMQRTGQPLSEVEKADIKSQADGGLNTLQSIDTWFVRAPRLSGYLEFHTSLDDARRLAEAQLKATLQDPPKVPFSTFEAAYSANWTSYDLTLSVLEQVLRADIDRLYTREIVTLSAIVGCLLLVLYLFASFYASTLRTVSLLHTASRRMERDAVVEPVSTRTRDEMGEVVDAFNKVAEKLRIELEQALRETQRATVAESALRESEERLREALVTAESANAAKSRFLANMSHELRTPLNAIIGYSEMLEEEVDERGIDDLAPDLRRILDAARHLLALINDILDISKIEAGKMEVFRENIDVNALLDDVVATVRPLATRNRNTLEETRAADLGQVSSDAAKIRQSLLNLLSNACKFTENGSVTLEAWREPEDAQDMLVFRVRDTGIGMSTEQMERLFQEFTQADASTTRKYGGTGLGLAITRRFCEMLGGRIDVESTPGSGSTFTMRMLAAEARPSSAQAAAPAAGASLVLIIDDDPAALDLLGRFLRKEGFEVITASNGEDGLRLARERHPAVISLDIMLPGMDGWAVLETLKSTPELADIPVIILTMLDDQQRGYALGATDFLVKPLDRDRLARVMRRYRVIGRQACVLVVDDEADIRELLKRQMTSEGWKVETAENGEEALARCEAHAPDLILLDLMMPVMDGFEFVDRLRAREDGQTIPVVVLTARDLSGHDRERLTGHVDRILQKAGQGRENLLGEVRGMISRIRSTAAAPTHAP